MRIIGGTWRGRRLEAPAGLGTRPMLDRVREALFNVLGPRVAGAEVWDLFAGTGSLGLEALSRGAARVWFVERSGVACRVLQGNLERLQGTGPDGPGRWLRGDAWEPPLPASSRPDLIFLDPPYAEVRRDPGRAVNRAAALRERLRPGGLLVFHHPAGAAPAALGLLAGDLRIWGTSAVRLLASPEGKP